MRFRITICGAISIGRIRCRRFSIIGSSTMTCHSSTAAITGRMMQCASGSAARAVSYTHLAGRNGGLRRTWADYRCGNRHAAARSAFHLQGQDDTVGPETPVCRPYPQGCEAVSYTHLDVYKRQGIYRGNQGGASLSFAAE